MKPFLKSMLRGIQAIHADELVIRLSKIRCMERLATRLWDSRSPAQFRKMAEDYALWLGKIKVSLEGKRVLEIGSGSSIGAGFYLAPHRYSQWTGTDYCRNPLLQSHLARKELGVVADAVRVTGMPQAAFLQSGKPLAYARPYAFTLLDITTPNQPFVDEQQESFDVIVSNAVLEHIPADGLSDAFRTMFRLLRPGGVMIHLVDLRDHVNFAAPFHFYRYSSTHWEFLVRGSIFYTNRFRSSDFERYARDAQFSVENYVDETQPLPQEIHGDLVKRYSLDVLAVSRIVLVCRKPMVAPTRQQKTVVKNRQ